MENCDFFAAADDVDDDVWVLFVVVAFMVARLSLEVSLATMLGDDEIFLMLHTACFPVVFEFGNLVVADELLVAVLDA